MIEAHFMAALCDFLRDAVKDLYIGTAPRLQTRRPGSLYLEDPEQTEQAETLEAVRVYNGFLPLKTPEDPADHPFVFARPISGEVDNGLTTLNVGITVGVYAADQAGYLDAGNTARRVISALTTLPDNHLTDKYERQTKITFEVRQELEIPFWGIDIMTTWLIYANNPTNKKDFI